MKNILIIGGAGYIGRSIINLLKKKNYNIFVIDNLSTTKKNFLKKKIKFYKIDICNKKILSNNFKKNNYDTVIHLAAKCIVSEGEKLPKKYYNINVEGTKNIINCSKKYKIKNFIFSSSCSIYSNKIKKVSENSPKKPISVYGKTKLISENLIIKNFIKYKIKFIILRYFNVVGADAKKDIGEIGNKDRLFNNISNKLINFKRKINIYGKNYKTKDGTCIRDYIHVNDLADIHIKCLGKFKNINKYKILNCSYGKGHSVLEVIKSFQKFVKFKIIINYKKKRLGDMKEITSTNIKLKKFINWKPKYNDIDQMVSSTLTWKRYLKKNKKKLIN